MPSALVRGTRQRTQRKGWQLWTGNTNIPWQLRYFYSHFRDRETDTRDLTTVTSLKMEALGLKPGHLVLKRKKGIEWDSWGHIGTGYETNLPGGHGPCCLRWVTFKKCFMNAQVIVNNRISVARKGLRKKRPHTIEMCLKSPTSLGFAPK